MPFDVITQFDKLASYSDIPDVYAGVVIWLYEKDKVLYAPINLIKRLKGEGKKSIGIKALNEYEEFIEIPSEKKRVMMSSDYSILLNLGENKKDE